MHGRSLSVYEDTSASHEYLCTLIKNGHEFCKLLIKRTQNSRSMKLHLKIKCYKLRKSRLKFMQIRTILYQYIKTLIEHVFLLNFTCELLMSFRSKYKGRQTSWGQLDVI